MAIGCPPSCFKKNASLDSDQEPDRVRFFTYKELKKATGNFKIKLGDGGYGSVYEGKLQNKRTVAVKVLKLRTQKSFEQFNNEVKLLSGLRHQNLVVFYGCTKPHEELLLVYEFVSNRTLKYHLHDQRVPFVWPLRIRIAIEMAEGIAYLHSAKSPIIHRDVKTDNVLLDHNFHVKIADFGLSRLLSADETDVTTITPSTAGYEDPEYKRCLKFTLNSDVYSFGVVLVELITRKKAVDVYRGPGNIFLNEIAPNIIRNKELEQLVDPAIGYHSDSDAKRIIDSVAELALECLQPTGEMRPPMVEVLRVLKEIYDEMQHLAVFEDIIKGIAQERPHKFTARIYAYKELKKATNSFHPSQLLDDGAYGGRAYIGKLRDGQTVAVKVLFDVDPRWLEQFFNGVSVLYRYRHQNLVNFYGCTNPQDNELLLVYEFVPNGNVSDHLHGKRPMLTWNSRIQIAIETSEAIAYLHSLQPQIIHNDVKTVNILLDDDLHVKVAGLGEHGLLPLEPKSHESTRVRGTIGYIDPEYNHTLRLSDKSDVYSFGVVLLELISGKQAIDLARDADEIYLNRMALDMIRNNRLDELVDPKLGYHLDDDVTRMIGSVVEVACMCLREAVTARPPMAEVLEFLKGIKDGTKMVHGIEEEEEDETKKVYGVEEEDDDVATLGSEEEMMASDCDFTQDLLVAPSLNKLRC